MSVVDTSQLCLSEESLNELDAWISTLSLSRPKKNLARDFSDGVLVAEILAQYMPKLVDLKHYSPASSVQKKKINWNTLNWKVFQKMGILLCGGVIQQLVDCKPGAIEQVLWDIRRTIGGEASAPRAQSPSPAAAKVPKSAPIAKAGKELERADLIRSFKPDEDKNGNIVTNVLTPKAAQNSAYLRKDDSPNPKLGGSSGGDADDELEKKIREFAELEKKIREFADLERTNASLRRSLKRLRTLVDETDQQIEDLAIKLRELRSIFKFIIERALAGADG